MTTQEFARDLSLALGQVLSFDASNILGGCRSVIALVHRAAGAAFIRAELEKLEARAAE